MTTPPGTGATGGRRTQPPPPEPARGRPLAIAGVAIAVVVIAVVALVVIKLVGGSSNDAGTPAKTGGQAVIAEVTSVSAATLDKVGVGTVEVPPRALAGAAPITADGKPLVLFAGGDFCPYCAATRWGLVVALSRFGTFHNLGQTSSSSTDSYPNTASLSFHGSTYTSDLITFHGYETRDRDGQPLDKMSAADTATLEKYDAPPYVPSANKGAIPFIDFGGNFFTIGADFDPGLLQGLTQRQIADTLNDPTSEVAQAILGQANEMTAAICSLTKQQPAAVCSSSGVKAGAGKLVHASS